MDNKIITFLHSGDAGDIIAGLATVKEICEKENAKAILFLDTTGGTSCNDDDLNNNIFILDNYVKDNPNGGSIMAAYSKNIVANNNVILDSFGGISFWG